LGDKWLDPCRETLFGNLTLEGGDEFRPEFSGARTIGLGHAIRETVYRNGAQSKGKQRGGFGCRAPTSSE